VCGWEKKVEVATPGGTPFSRRGQWYGFLAKKYEKAGGRDRGERKRATGVKLLYNIRGLWRPWVRKAG